MKQELNLYELLRGHEGETFYSPVCGDVVIKNISVNDDGEIYIDTEGFIFDGYGKLNHLGECILFPSKDQRDWSKWAEEQKPKIPKIFDEIPPIERDYFTRPGNVPFELNKIQKSAIALLKIHQLIEIGYGGNITNEEWEDDEQEKYVISYILGITTGICYNERNHIAFHTQQQREEFLSYPENIQLLKDYYIV